MGVPKFFRFLIDRYPCIRINIKEHEIPTYDNLYLDMNSIIHACSHPTDADVYFRVGRKEFSDEDIFQNVSRYVDLIFRIVKPLKVMFLAFDGVTPRAKMNQQRATRFRVSKKFDDDNELGEQQELLDTNCITPGTTFMAELIEHMRHFVAYKISTDPMWQGCKIILSGPEVPGEGEHKIMQYIRYEKTLNTYDCNTRHCVYSIDADMIVLGLCCHIVHFSLIQETIRFGKRKLLLTPEESEFHLLHLCVLREYLQKEFGYLFDDRGIVGFDSEKIIDDWVLLGFLVGNDFVPQLPKLNIVDGALPFLYKIYVDVFPNLNGYINESGVLNLKRFEMFLKYLFSFEKKLESESSAETRFSTNSNDDGDKFADVPLKTAINADIQTNLRLQDLKLDDSECSTKSEYYKTKLKVTNFEESDVKVMVTEYVRAVQWTLAYYYQGCISWSWYYPYHYAPHICDVRNVQNVSLKFEGGKPFLPLQHLLAVLPPISRHLLPKAYQTLLISETSPIIHFYPTKFEIDLNGKTNDFEAIVILPFIDEKELLSAMEPYNKKLSSKDKIRNKMGQTCIFTYTETNLGKYPVDTMYDDFINHAQLQHILLEDVFLSDTKGLDKKADARLRFPGFPIMERPSLSTVSFMKKEKNTIPRTTVEYMYMKLNHQSQCSLDAIAKNILTKTVYINWPYLQEAYVVGVTDFKNKIILKDYWKKYAEDNITLSNPTLNVVQSLKNDCDSIAEKYKNNMGIDIGETKVMVYALPAFGKQYVCDARGIVRARNRWKSVLEAHPYQTLEKNVTQIEKPLPFKLLKDIYSPSSICFSISHPYYGAMGTVKNLHLAQQKVTITLAMTNEPDFTLLDKKCFSNNTVYMSSGTVAQKLGVSSKLINRISGSVFVKDESDKSKYFDIGLHMKSPKYNKELCDYTTKRNNSWAYSDKAVQLIKSYIEKFPDMFQKFKSMISSESFFVADFFPEEGLSGINAVLNWITDQTQQYPPFKDCNTKSIESEGVEKLEKFVDNFKVERETIDTTLSCKVLFRPGTTIGLVSPDPKANHKILDRVVCVKDNFTVPLGFKGTIIGKKEKENKYEIIYEVLFDSSFTGGLSLYNSSEQRYYRLTIADFINISHGQRNPNNNLEKHPKKDTGAEVAKNEINSPKNLPINSSKKNSGSGTRPQKFVGSQQKKVHKNVPHHEKVKQKKVSGPCNAKKASKN